MTNRIKGQKCPFSVMIKLRKGIKNSLWKTQITSTLVTAQEKPLV